MRASSAATTVLALMLLGALACKSGTGGDGSMNAGVGAAGSSPAALDPMMMGGNAAALAPPPPGNGGGAPASGTGAGGTAVPVGPIDMMPAGPTDAGVALPNRPMDAAAAPPDARPNVNTDPDCPTMLPEVYATCPREGLMCEYGMECCPDYAWCEFGQWTVLTHHCDACI